MSRRATLLASLALLGLAAAAFTRGAPAAPRELRVPEPSPGDTTLVLVHGSAIDAAARSLAAATSPTDVARDLPTGDVSRYQLVVINRRVAAAAEIHDGWSDVVLVRRGSAELRTGWHLADRAVKGPGEWTGSDITDARTARVGAGDVIVIPAGMAHQWRPADAAGFAYLVLKVRPGGAVPGAMVH